MDIYGHNDIQHVWRQPGTAYKVENTIPTIKHPKSLMLWGSMSEAGVGNLVRIDGRMNAEDYVKILEENVKSSARKMKLGRKYFFQQDNGMLKFLETYSVSVCR